MEDGYQSVSDLFGDTRYADRYKPNGKKAVSERAMLIGYFSKKMGWTPIGAAMHLDHLKDLRDLYYLKSDCDQAEARGVAWRAAFRTALRIRKADRPPKPPEGP